MTKTASLAGVIKKEPKIPELDTGRLGAPHSTRWLSKGLPTPVMISTFPKSVKKSVSGRFWSTRRSSVTCFQIKEENVPLVSWRGIQVVTVRGRGRVKNDVAHVQGGADIESKLETLLWNRQDTSVTLRVNETHSGSIADSTLALVKVVGSSVAMTVVVTRSTASLALSASYQRTPTLVIVKCSYRAWADSSEMEFMLSFEYEIAISTITLRIGSWSFLVQPLADLSEYYTTLHYFHWI